MQLYVSDYLGDTRHLSCEQHGAYLLLLMTMWNAGGSLPDDDVKLARIVGLSVKKWKAIRDDVIAFFTTTDGLIGHNRMTKELQKSEAKSHSRASAGARGGRAKALKDKDAHVVNASRLLQHLPDTRDHMAASQQRAPAFLYDQLLEAASARGNCHQALAMGIQPIVDLLAKGYDLDADVLPVIREKADPSRRSWSYFVTIIVQRQAEKQAIPAKPAPPSIDWNSRLDAYRDHGLWPHGWGPKPGEPGCRAPSEVVGRHAA